MLQATKRGKFATPVWVPWKGLSHLSNRFRNLPAHGTDLLLRSRVAHWTYFIREAHFSEYTRQNVPPSVHVRKVSNLKIAYQFYLYPFR